MESKTKDKVTYICLSQVKEMGFNDKLVKDLLPEPILKDNPYYKKAMPMKLWDETIVKKAMETEAYKAYQIKRAKRQESAKKAVKTKTDKLIAEIEAKIPTISVKRIDFTSLKNKALQSKQSWYDYQADIRNSWEWRKTVNGADEATIRRWMVNYIRHKLTTYDSELEIIFNRTGKDKGFVLLHNAVLDKIAETYPELADECDNQKYYTEEEIADKGTMQEPDKKLA